MASNIREVIADAKKHYTEVIKPLIGEGFYQVAGYELGNLNFLLKSHTTEIRGYHSGHLFMASSLMLEERLKRSQQPSTQMFEAYLAQINLAIESGNNF